MIDFTDFQKLKAKLEPIFVPVKEENDYCRKHKISRVKLDNGTKIYGIERLVEDSFYASVDFNFRTGSWFDPIEKKGIHHLLEHLFNQLLYVQTADKAGLEINASTGPIKLREWCSGTANPKYSNFGILPLLEMVVAMLKSPVDQYSKPQSYLDSEKLVVMKEMMERDTSQTNLARMFVNELILDEKNPYRAGNWILGTKNSLEGIAVDDCRIIANKYLNPGNLVVSYLTEAGGGTANYLGEHLTKLLDGDSKSNQELNLINYFSLEEINDKIKGGYYTHTTSLKNDTVELRLIWPTTAQPQEPGYYILNRLCSSLNEGFHLLARRNGWSYSSWFGYNMPFWFNFIFVAGLTVPKNNNRYFKEFGEKVCGLFVKEVLGRINQQVAEEMINEDLLNMFANPVKQTRRLGLLLQGEQELDGRIIDPDRIREIQKRVTVKDIFYWRDYLMETKPVVVAVGDLI